MKLYSQIALLFLTAGLYACSSGDDPLVEPEIPIKNDTGFMWEEKRDTILGCKDLVLIYGGGAHRTTTWSKDYMAPYVTYKDASGNEHWLFDGFLFLEFKNGLGKMFAEGYDSTGANQHEWKALADYYFQSKIALGGLDNAIEEAIVRVGQPSEKRKVVICLPEPITGQKDWGSVKNGVQLDFSKPADRISACKWYINYVRGKFKELQYDNIELAGFYWIAEDASTSRSIIADIGIYCNSLKYSFNWIPYYSANGYSEWKILGFNYGYLQPNYFFTESLSYSRLEQACTLALQNGMDMELEFDEKALAASGWGYRLSNYLKAFKQYGIWSYKRIAYYQGNLALYYLSKSSNPEDQKLYQEFCEFVSKRH